MVVFSLVQVPTVFSKKAQKILIRFFILGRAIPFIFLVIFYDIESCNG